MTTRRIKPTAIIAMPFSLVGHRLTMADNLAALYNLNSDASVISGFDYKYDNVRNRNSVAEAKSDRVTSAGDNRPSFYPPFYAMGSSLRKNDDVNFDNLTQLSRLQLVSRLLPWTCCGAVAGWLAGVALWLHRVPTAFAPTSVDIGGLSMFFAFALPVAIPFARFYRSRAIRSAILKSGVGGACFGSVAMPQNTATFVTRLDILFSDPFFAYEPTTGILITSFILFLGTTYIAPRSGRSLCSDEPRSAQKT